MFFYKKVNKDLWKFLEVGFSLLYIGIFLGCIALFIKGDNYITVAYLWGVADLSIHLNTTIKHITYSFYVDRLSLFFIGIVAFNGAINSIYTLDYIEEENYDKKILMTMLKNIFILSMILVLLSANAFTFLLFWEVMSILSFFLVLWDFKKEENYKASLIYIVMTHIGTAFILLSFVGFYINTNSLSFDHWQNLSLNTFWTTWIFLFSVLGFGMKAGIIGLHNWLPKAHPVAPSFVSALMSGLMIKMPVYMFIRYWFYFIKQYPASFGLLILTIGTITMLFGILNASVQNRLKAMLAYSSMENIGIIYVGIGLAMIFKSLNVEYLYALALGASLFHILNHSLFKSLLFMSAGSLMARAHTQEIAKLGGAIKYAPKLGTITLVGMLSLVALPPFNGFISEWLLYQSLLLSLKVKGYYLWIASPLSASFLALTGGIAMLSAVKYFGLTFLGNPRKDIKRKEDIKTMSLISMGILALSCLLVGVLPVFVLDVINNLIPVPIHVNGIFEIKTPENFGSIAPFFIGILMVFMLLISIYLNKYISKHSIYYKTWACGQEDVPLSAQYSPEGFSQPIKKITSKLYKDGLDIFDGIYGFIAKSLLNKLQTLKYKIQTGVIHVYILYMAITLIILIWVSKIYG
ncbi:NADH dehydrogenase (quinone) [Hydrogenobaculum sp. Y04AAS1]|uniref:proton-conducting transporter transmembrane domain-containing protein n=1 Tax=Hydrogenobaculum sp. (strain Y04AAS1) TaxID=380749 RepID=UPI00015BC864|nr:NADH dehydrogenase (quinone) [Hydrogenobaculum sp. Y04AAS1]HCT66011.1 hydrogenase 4 subunit B [Hydrogenobaculum sp.]